MAPSPAVTSPPGSAGAVSDPAPPWGERIGTVDRMVVGVFIGIPFLALVAAVPLLWGWGLDWPDVVLAVGLFFLTGHGITIGFHRLFTHKAFRANRPLKMVLAFVGTMAIEGDVIGWVADHRRHHRYSDRDGDPHSPWRYGNSFGGLVKGFVWAHVGWSFNVQKTNRDRFVRDLMADPDVVRMSSLPAHLAAVVTSFGLPALLGWLWTGTGHGALTAFFWAGLVRISLVHHVTWSVNSVCHLAGDRPFRVRDHSGNVWWLALLSGGESWHNLHHADPTCARHGVDRGQVDSSAAIIKTFEKLGWAHDVRWPDPARLAKRRVSALA